MAHKVVIPHSWLRARPNLAKFGKHICNLDGSVGLNCANKSTDVLLVQVFINIAFEWRADKKGPGVTSQFTGDPGGVVGPASALVNGEFDNLLVAWIYYYQLFFFS